MDQLVLISLTKAELSEMINEAVSIALANQGPQRSESPESPISRKELMQRLNVTEPTVIRWQKKGKIPFMKIGRAVRYDWKAVVKSLDKTKAA